MRGRGRGGPRGRMRGGRGMGRDLVREAAEELDIPLQQLKDFEREPQPNYPKRAMDPPILPSDKESKWTAFWEPFVCELQRSDYHLKEPTALANDIKRWEPRSRSLRAKLEELIDLPPGNEHKYVPAELLGDGFNAGGIALHTLLPTKEQDRLQSLAAQEQSKAKADGREQEGQRTAVPEEEEFNVEEEVYNEDDDYVQDHFKSDDENDSGGENEATF